MIRFFCLAAVMSVALLGSAMPAQASFGNCNDPAYIAQFDARLGRLTDFLCVTGDPIPVHSDSGVTHIRIIQHLVADWATRPGAMNAIKQGVADAAAAMSRLGRFRIADTTILLVDGFGPGGDSEDFGSIAAWTNGADPNECRITFWLLGSGATASHGGFVSAHELFHCVQTASLSAAQVASSGYSAGRFGGGAWWSEGSADWFGTLAQPAPPAIRDRVTTFDAHSQGTPLNAMSYDAFVFFAWLGQNHGPNAVIPFLRSMASSGDASAQREAMTAAMPETEWLKFAEDYVDQKIKDGQGASIGSTPQTGQTYEWTATENKSIDLVPFVLNRGTVTERCGRWSFTPTPARFHGARNVDQTEWGPLPTNLDATREPWPRFRFAAMATGDRNTRLRLRGELIGRCEECAGSKVVDRCMVGTWTLTRDGMLEWMRTHIHKFDVTGIQRPNSSIVFTQDGSFASIDDNVTVQGRGSRLQARGQSTSQGAGRWSISGGRLNMCFDAGSMEGSGTVSRPGFSATVPVTAGPGTMTGLEYTCSAGAMSITMPVGNLGPLTNGYTKSTAPHP